MRHFINSIDVVQTLASILIALMHRVDTQVSGHASRLGFAPLPDRDGSGPRGLIAGIALAVPGGVAQPVKMRH